MEIVYILYMRYVSIQSIHLKFTMTFGILRIQYPENAIVVGPRTHVMFVVNWTLEGRERTTQRNNCIAQPVNRI
jgi:hypothetical protein